MSDPAYYAVIPATVRYDADLPANAKLLYGEIAALANRNGYCWAPNSYFTELYGVSDRSVSRWIETLIKKGYLFRDVIRNAKQEVTERRLYVNDLPRGFAGADPPNKNVTTSRQKPSNPPDKNVTTSRQKQSDPPDKNVGENNTRENNTRESARKQAYGELHNVFLTNEELKRLIQRFNAPAVQRTIDRLSCYMESCGKKYKSHYATLLNWLKEDSEFSGSQIPVAVATELEDRGVDEW